MKAKQLVMELTWKKWDADGKEIEKDKVVKEWNYDWKNHWGGRDTIAITESETSGTMVRLSKWKKVRTECKMILKMK